MLLSPMEIHEGAAQDLSQIFAFIDHLISERFQKRDSGKANVMDDIQEAEKGDIYHHALSRVTRNDLLRCTNGLCRSFVEVEMLLRGKYKIYGDEASSKAQEAYDKCISSRRLLLATQFPSPIFDAGPSVWAAWRQTQLLRLKPHDTGYWYWNELLSNFRTDVISVLRDDDGADPVYVSEVKKILTTIGAPVIDPYRNRLWNETGCQGNSDNNHFANKDRFNSVPKTPWNHME
ncbi:hypothetical protein AK830_g11617 [Neonectria ditissima]|uniref:Uncharacterized protein n=1 Tax=Neonectria ditissima TaxID=78410 RepID=A0A0P7B0X4_9HYPO|nr:hypothetical protein AK830_g11617 [Neonectria ditissima]